MYKKIERLCSERKISIAKLCKEVGISNSTFTELKSGRTKELSARNTLKVANYFEVSVDYLMNIASTSSEKNLRQQQKKPLPENEERLMEIYELTDGMTESEFIALRAFVAGLKANRKPE